MGKPQIILIVLISLDLLFVALKNGKPSPDYNIVVEIVGAGIMVWILIAGGFF